LAPRRHHVFARLDHTTPSVGGPPVRAHSCARFARLGRHSLGQRGAHADTEPLVIVGPARRPAVLHTLLPNCTQVRATGLLDLVEEHLQGLQDPAAEVRQVWPLSHAKHHVLQTRTLVMGILNVTPDSFSDGGHFLQRYVIIISPVDHVQHFISKPYACT
jgi:hypothetical protein